MVEGLVWPAMMPLIGLFIADDAQNTDLNRSVQRDFGNRAAFPPPKGLHLSRQ